MLREIYLDDFGNIAYLDHIKILPYNEAKTRVDSYRITCEAKYDNNLVFFVSIYETKEDALDKLSKLSCGTYRKV